jgi:hypothetical protein
VKQSMLNQERLDPIAPEYTVMISSIGQIAVTVRDVDSALSFYRDARASACCKNARP